MPHIDNSTYVAPIAFHNAHAQTCFPSLFRVVPGVHYERERVHTPDQDFIDLDWSRVPSSSNLVVICHGLEADSQSTYIKGMVKAFNKRGWSSVIFNFRGCSGEANLLLKSYHSGATEDLDLILRHISAQKKYDQVVLVGFSLGGNVMLKFLGDGIFSSTSLIAKAAAVSVPCHLKSSVLRLAEKSNLIYMRRFLKKLNPKIRDKIHLMPGAKYEDFLAARTFLDFDNLYTAPVHGFKDADDYYEKCSARQFLKNIKIPTLLINAWDDPFLAKECFPVEEAQKNPFFTLETPQHGGHVGFVTFHADGEYWHEKRVTSFVLLE
jgi:predicted alpha/beta-fold hydrolase